MSQEHLDKTFVDGLKKIYENNWPDFCDLTIACADGEKVSAPKLILAVRSEYFAALFRHEPQKYLLNLPQFNSDLMRIVIGSLIVIDEDQLKDAGLDQVIRVADYFQITDLVMVISDLMGANINKENLQEMIHLTQEINVPNLEYACMKFLKDDVVEIFDSEPSIFQTLSKKMWTELLKYPLAKICDKVGRQCDVLETLENLYYILIETLKTSNRFQELPYFINNCLHKEDLYAIFIDGQSENFDKLQGYVGVKLLPKRLKITDDVKNVVSSMCPKTENFFIPRASFEWSGPYGSHNDIALIPEIMKIGALKDLCKKYVSNQGMIGMVDTLFRAFKCSLIMVKLKHLEWI